MALYAENIPLIDLEWDRRKLIQELDRACVEWGFFQVVNHGVPSASIEGLRKAMTDFFCNTPVEIKNSVFRTSSNARGYFDNELTKRILDYKECFDVGFEGKYEIDGENQWPKEPKLFKQRVQRYMNDVDILGMRLLCLLAEAIGLNEHELDNEFTHKTSFLRLNYYPKCEALKVADENLGLEEPDRNVQGVFSINRHTDAGAITVLLQNPSDPHSLQVYSRKQNKFVRVIPHPDSFTINIGDVLQVWSNDRYQSPVHRVLANSEKSRFSVPYFLNPNYTSICNKRSKCDNLPGHYIPFEWGQFRKKRFQGDYADVGEEVQISDWRIQRPNAAL